MAGLTREWGGDPIDLKGKNKAEILAALYNGCKGCRRRMDVKEAQGILDATGMMFDRIDGLTLKVNLTKDAVWPVTYDQYNGGTGTMQRVLKEAGLL